MVTGTRPQQQTPKTNPSQNQPPPKPKKNPTTKNRHQTKRKPTPTPSREPTFFDQILLKCNNRTAYVLCAQNLLILSPSRQLRNLQSRFRTGSEKHVVSTKQMHVILSCSFVGWRVFLIILRFWLFFWLPAARVRVPGGSPFSQLKQREKDNSTVVKSNKNIHNHWTEQ